MKPSAGGVGPVRTAMFTTALLALCLVPGTGCRGCGSGKEKTTADSMVIAEIKSVIREGDIVFRRGDGLTSRAVLAADAGGTYSHVGIVVASGRIVHIVPGEEDDSGVKDVIKTEDPEAFFAPDRASRGAVMRFEYSDTVVLAAREAERLAEKVIEFDHDYDLDDTTRMYCTELVWRVFDSAGFDPAEGRRTKINLPGFRGTYILPTDIENNTRLELIYRF